MNRRGFFKQGLGVGAALAASVNTGLGQAKRTSVPTATKARTKWEGDLAVVNAKIMTLEARQPEAAAVLVRNGRIVLVDTNEVIRSQARDTPIFDAGGRTVVPGFIDAHCHMEVTAAALMYCADVHTPPLKNIPEIQAALRAWASRVPKGQWIVGRGDFNFENAIVEKRLPNRLELDAVSLDRPVLVFAGRHITMANTQALKQMGVWEPNAKLPRGTLVHRDDAGVPTGICTEVFYYLPGYSIDQMKAAIQARASELFTAQGTTTIYTIPFSKNDIRADLELQRAGDLPLRIRMFYHVPHMTSFEGLMDTGFLSGVGDDMFRFGGMKLFVDGAGSDGLGHRFADLKWTQPELNDMVSGADANRMQVFMHCVTPEGRKMAITAVEETRRRNPRQPYILHRIEHNGDDGTIEGIRHLRDLGIRVSITPGRIRPGSLGPRYRTLVKEGLDPAVITDTTGTTPGTSDILFKIACIATPSDEGGGASPNETLSFQEALRLFTLANARIGYEDQYKGSIAVGKLGDFAVLSGDPRDMAPAKLFDLKVQATILGGEIVYGA
jgi:predicted amidohydrolase YtcJ